MSDPDPIIEKYGEYPDLLDVLHNRLGIRERRGRVSHHD
jgi:hypothetical protein